MEPKVNKRTKLLLAISMVASVIYLGWRIFFTIPMDYGLVSLIAGIFLVVAETIGVIEAFSHYRNLQGRKIPDLPSIPDNWYPEVDVLIATHNEPEDVLYATINGCKHMKYPDLSKVHIWVCDDMDRPGMRQLAEKMGVGYFGLADNKSAKAGNLNNAIRQTSAELLVTFDADMIPTSDFLIKTIPYMFLPKVIQEDDGSWRPRTEDEIDPDFKMGFIQTPQSFYNADLFQFNLFAEIHIPNEQDYFFQGVNVGRNRTNSAIYAGSNTVISRAALADAGGMVEGNITEDFATGINIQAKGYRTLAIPTPLAHGLAPGDFRSLIRQRQRWARGCVQTIRSRKFLFGSLPLAAKFSYFASFLYWWTFMRRLIYILAPILFVVFGIVVVDCSPLELLLIWLPSYLLYNQTLKVLSGRVRTQMWSNIVDTILFPYMIGPVFAETVGITLRKFHVTAKEHTKARTSKMLYGLPHILLIIPTIYGVYLCADSIFVGKAYGALIVLYWLLMNGYFLVMAIAFYGGRVNYRGADRFYTKVDVEIKTPYTAYEVVTSDLSVTGLSVLASDPHFMPPDEPIEVTVSYKNYKATFLAKVVHVNKADDLWKYAIEITNISDRDKAEYYQINFDREHTLAKTVRSRIQEDVATVVAGVTRQTRMDERKLPRLEIGATVAGNGGGEVFIEDYNYQFIAVRNLKAELGDHVELELGDNVTIGCTVKTAVSDGTLLCEVDDWKVIALDASVQDKLGAPRSAKSAAMSAS